MLTCYYYNLALDSGPIGIWCNLLKLWNVLKVPLVWNGGNELLTEGSESSLCNSRHDEGPEILMDCTKGRKE